MEQGWSRGCVIYSLLASEQEQEPTNLKEVRMEGSNYKLGEDQILTWLQIYGTVESSMKEEADVLEEKREESGESLDFMVSTGSYILQMRLKHQIPNEVLMQGTMVKLCYEGFKIQC